MIRIRIDALTRDGNRLLLDGEPFTGLAYVVDEIGCVAENRCVIDGEPTGTGEAWEAGVARVTYESLWFGDPQGNRFDSEEDELETWEVFWQDDVFRGVVYEFDRKGRLQSERKYDSAFPSAGREWYPCGARQTEYIVRTGQTVFDIEGWYQDGTRKQLSIGTSEFGAGWGSSGKLGGLRCTSPKHFWRLAPLELEVSHSLVLGPVDDVVLLQLRGLENLTDFLALERTSITPAGLRVFRVCHNLREISTRGNHHLSADDFRELADSLPDCKWVDLDEWDTRLAESRSED